MSGAVPPGVATELPPAERELVAALEARSGVRFRSPRTALAALTHRSWVNEHPGDGLEDNERLEFLGDAVVDLAVSHRLMERFPAAREGELSKMRAAVVDEPGLAALARAFELGTLLRLGRGEELTGGREKPSLLADAMEAVVAAVYLEGGLDAVLAVIDRYLEEAFERAGAGTLDRDYKTQLQELAQSRFRARAPLPGGGRAGAGPRQAVRGGGGAARRGGGARQRPLQEGRRAGRGPARHRSACRPTGPPLASRP